jgi:hypothetical protein
LEAFLPGAEDNLLIHSRIQDESMELLWSSKGEKRLPEAPRTNEQVPFSIPFLGYLFPVLSDSSTNA